MEEQMRKEKEEFTIAMEKQKKVYESQIANLQRQVDLAQSMISSTCSNFTFDSERQNWDAGERKSSEKVGSRG